MDCQLILKQDAFFSLSHHKASAVLQAFTGHCLDLSQPPASSRSPLHWFYSSALGLRAAVWKQFSTVNQGSTFAGGAWQELAGGEPSGSSLGMLLPRVQPYHTWPYHTIPYLTIPFFARPHQQSTPNNSLQQYFTNDMVFKWYTKPCFSKLLYYILLIL